MCIDDSRLDVCRVRYVYIRANIQRTRIYTRDEGIGTEFGENCVKILVRRWCMVVIRKAVSYLSCFIGVPT